MEKKITLVFAFLYVAALSFGQASADEFNRSILPMPDPPFKGKIGLRASDSVKDFPKEVQAPKDARNVLLILTDDVGFGSSSTFGGPIPIDRGWSRHGETGGR
jgi:hypothetical protein